jgi:hypothetical protein
MPPVASPGPTSTIRRAAATIPSFCGAPSGCSYAAASNITKTGWAVGVGYEAALAGNWTVRAEYFYYSFDGQTLSAVGTPLVSCGGPFCAATYKFPDLNIHTVRVGLTYKLGQPAGAPVAIFAPSGASPVRGWTGALRRRACGLGMERRHRHVDFHSGGNYGARCAT